MKSVLSFKACCWNEAATSLADFVKVVAVAVEEEELGVGRRRRTAGRNRKREGVRSFKCARIGREIDRTCENKDDCESKDANSSGSTRTSHCSKNLTGINQK